MKAFFVFSFYLFFCCTLHAQFYWQQKVNYNIDVELNVDSNILYGKESVKYTNNSPDTLKDIYIHLYWNAFKPGSYMNLKSIAANRENGKRISNLKPDEQGDVQVKKITVDGLSVQTDEHDTILKLFLNKPLNPMSSAIIELDFKSQAPKLVRRAGRDNQQGVRYSMAQWYPKICEYDNEGWHNDEYAGREFYGIWGSFDVKITLDANYILGSTGIIQNPQEVKCGYDLPPENTTWKKSETDSFPKGTLKTWHFKADSVHDFAWAADNRFIHDIFSWEDVIIHSLYLPEYQSRWEKVKYYSNIMLDFYSENYGRYPYKQFTVIQAGDGGMEYPAIIFNAGYSPGLVAHEGGHQWFYGILGNNESKEAWLDEGFITYTTMKNLVDRFGYKYINPTGFDNILQPPGDEHGDQKNYWTLAKLGIEEPVLTHSDLFSDDMVYGFETYQKGGMIIPMLEYTIGDSAFALTMKNYFDEWKFKHPKTGDFQRVAEKTSGMELDWFFDEWLRTTKTCDYAFKRFSGKWIEINGVKKYRLNCELENRDDIIMPIDLEFTLCNGNKRKFIIPVDWNSKIEKDALILPRWDWVTQNYSFYYDFDEEVESGIIDPSLRLTDLNRLNNTSGYLPKFDVYFIRPIQLNPPIDAYWINYRPSLCYSLADGLKPGLVAWGGYLGNELVPPEHSSRFGLWYAFKSMQVDFDFGYSLPFSSLGRMAYLNLSFSKMNGIRYVSGELTKLLEPFILSSYFEQKASIKISHCRLIENDFPLYKMNWDRGDLNLIEIMYSLKSQTVKLKVNTEFSFSSIQDYSKAAISLSSPLYRNYLNIRLFGGYSTSLPPIQSQFNLSMGSSIEQYNNRFYRDITGIHKSFSEDIGLTYEGGGNIKGYSYIYRDFYGKNILSLNLEALNIPLSVIIGNNIPVISGIIATLFYDVGNVWSSKYNKVIDFHNNFRSDAGIIFEIPQFNNKSLLTVLPFLEDLTLRFNIPFWLSNPEPGKKQFDWRWNISLGNLLL